MPDPIDPALIDLAARGGVHVSLHPGSAAHTFVVTVVAPDTPGLLSHEAGVLALNSLRVLSASLGSHGTSAINSFVVAPRFGAPPQAGLLRQELIRAMAGRWTSSSNWTRGSWSRAGRSRSRIGPRRPFRCSTRRLRLG